MMKLGSRTQGEVLDAEGWLYCPVRATTIDHELCFGCSFLGGVDTSEGGTVASVHCTPPSLFRLIPPA